jgi:hypothetical protein
MTMTTKILCEVVFSANLTRDADEAAAALREAGYDVARMPEHLLATVDVLGDEFIEASKSGDPDKIWEEVKKIVEPYNGDATECGEVPADYAPFSEERWRPTGAPTLQ